MSGDSSKYDSNDSTITLEGRFVQLYFNAIEKLPECWLNDSGFNKNKFVQQILFLISLLPYEDKQDEILEAWHKRMQDTKELMPNLSEDEYTFAASLVPVTKIMSFICSEFELITTDITGPATSKQYRDSAITVPDMILYKDNDGKRPKDIPEEQL
jgi:hypothetical protein